MGKIREHIQEGLDKAREFLLEIYNYDYTRGINLNEAIKKLEQTLEPKRKIIVHETDLSKLPDKPLGEISGFTRVLEEKNSIVIIVNSKDLPFRKRFTVAHELGHIYMKDNLESGLSFRSNPNKDKVSEDYYFIEQKANAFASELLMPTKIVEKLFFEEKKNIKEMANFFGVSYAAMRNKLGSVVGY